MTFRIQILADALMRVPSSSFTRTTLVSAVRSLRPEVSDPEGVVDTVFGSGQVGPVQDLVNAWEKVGKSMMAGVGEGKDRKGYAEILSRRLSFSSQVGEHLVEAYANLTTPQNTHNLPLSLSSIRTLLSSLPSPPAMYAPPGAPKLPNLSQLLNLPGLQNLPLLRLNPFGPLAYAWRIADETVYLATDKYLSTNHDKGRDLKRGYWNEPVGFGPEWYGERLGLALVYLAAESYLLQPYSKIQSQTGQNPHFPAALESLQTNLERYKSVVGLIEDTEENVGDAMGFVDYIVRSLHGLKTSRYW
ncbi:hypothetical protein L204_102529 [Cryptococcus depauperatus]|nr:hypothetical protein L204_00723 [Cryptococcus depauperatus CBS 7855]